MVVKFPLKRGYKHLVYTAFGENEKQLEVPYLRKHSNFKAVFIFLKRIDVNTSSSVDQIITNLPKPVKNGEKFMFAEELLEGMKNFWIFVLFFLCILNFDEWDKTQSSLVKKISSSQISTYFPKNPISQFKMRFKVTRLNFVTELWTPFLRHNNFFKILSIRLR